VEIKIGDLVKWPVPFGDGRVDIGLVLDVRPLIPYFDDEVEYYVPREYLIRWMDGDEEWCSEEDNLIVVSPQ
jgi:hypothetical protein